ncbi:MAG: ABC transporter permease [Woeseiaceae bacterium]|nr:ABC transporter permease [Woeseiaceae bacterium]
MFWNNIKIALRNLKKNTVFAAINIVGLAIGLSVYVFGGILVDYERNHDAFFENVDRVYTISSTAAPALNAGFKELNSVWTAVGPIIETEVDDLDAVARTIAQEYLVGFDDNRFYEWVYAADRDFLRIFDLDYVDGDATALDDPSSVIMSESSAIKYFGSTDVVGRTLTIDNQHDFYVRAIYKDVPQNSHFNSLPIIETTLGIVIPVAAMTRMDEDFDINGGWNNLSLSNSTYLMLPPNRDQEWLQSHLDNIYETHFSDGHKDIVSAIQAVPLRDANLALWKLVGIPAIEIVQLLSILVLAIACANYANLATAQALGRSREVGMRKTMGASQTQLLTQFLVESLVIATIAMIFAIAILEVLIPLFNNVTNKVVALDYLGTLPWLAATTIVVGLCAGAYPAWLITRASPIDALRDVARKGRSGSRVRSFMIGGQFAISTFMLALVAVVHFQNEKMEESSYTFPRDEVYTMARLNTSDVAERRDALRNEIENIPGVSAVGFSSQVPYEQSNSTTYLSPNPGEEASRFQVQLMRMSPEFLDVYDIPLLAGRKISRNIAGDEFEPDLEEARPLNVLVNEMFLEQQGISSPEAGLNQRFFEAYSDEEYREYIVVGVLPTQNFVGMLNPDKPWMYFYDPRSLRMASVRIEAGNMMSTVTEIERAWDRVVPEYPIQGRFLNDTFDDSFNVLRYTNMALAGFAFLALALAFIGLFGLAAFMAAMRTKEIGVRKVLGASSTQIARLLVWQFSKPVVWALALALPVAFFASSQYLNLFSERISSPVLVLVGAGLAAVMLAWSTVAGHAIRIARSNPVMALRYE